MRYNIMLECDSGTQRLVDSTAGCGWERVYHIITWCTEENIENANKALESIFVDGRWILRVWMRTVIS